MGAGGCLTTVGVTSRIIVSTKTLTFYNAYVILQAMLMNWVETNAVVQRKHTVGMEGSMKVQKTQEKQSMPLPARRLNLERIRQLAAEQKKGLDLLAKNDGPIVEAKRITRS